MLKILIISFNTYSGVSNVYTYNGSWSLENVSENAYELLNIQEDDSEKDIERKVVRYADNEICSAYLIIKNGEIVHHGTL